MEFARPQFVDVIGRRLAYEEVTPDLPEGTVQLLCGIGAKRQGWYKQLPVLGGRFRGLALDCRDVGDSDAATGWPSSSRRRAARRMCPRPPRSCAR
jgi:hypothetical protein